MASPTSKTPHFVAIRYDKAKSTKDSKVYPIRFCTLGGITFHAQTQTYDHQQSEYSSRDGQVLSISQEQITRAWRDADERVIQWHKTEGGWRSECVFKSSGLYESVETLHDPETNLVTQEEVPLRNYLVIRPHLDVDAPAASPKAFDSEAPVDPVATNAAGIEREEESANPREHAEVKRDQRMKKKFGPEAVPSTGE